MSNAPLDISKHDAVDANAQYLALLDATVDAIIVINHKGTIEIFNQAAEQIFGYQASEVINKNIKMLMPDPYQQSHDQYIQNYNQTKQAQIIGIGREVSALKKNGQEFPIELSIGEVKQSSHPQFIGIIRDISDRIKIESDLSNSRERLAQFTRLSTMGEIAAGIAHEINQPLTAITNYSQACRNFIKQQELTSDAVSFDKITGALDKITTQTHRASEVIKRLRAFVKKGHVSPSKVNLTTLINQTIKLAKADTRLLQQGVCWQKSRQAEAWVVVDDIQIQQVLINLINNAIDAMQGCQPAPIQIGSHWLNDKTIQVSVTDQGVGITKQQQETLFHPFYTTKPSGMGLGLSICETIIEAHSGKLTYSPGKSKGSVFSFTLPALKS